MSSEQVLRDDLVNGTIQEWLRDFNTQFSAFRVENNERFTALENANRPVLNEEATSSQRPVSVAPVSVTPSVSPE